MNSKTMKVQGISSTLNMESKFGQERDKMGNPNQLNIVLHILEQVPIKDMRLNKTNKRGKQFEIYAKCIVYNLAN